MAIRLKKPKFDEIIFGNGLIGQILNRRNKSFDEEEFVIDFANLPVSHKLPVRKDGFIQVVLKKKWLYRISADPAYHRYLYTKTITGGLTIFDEYKRILREKNQVLYNVRDNLISENLLLKTRFRACWEESNIYLKNVLAKNEPFIPPQSVPVEEIPVPGGEVNEPTEENQ